MKVKKALEILSQINGEENIAFIWFERYEFDDLADDPETGLAEPIWNAAIAHFNSVVDEKQLKEVLEIEISRLSQ